MKAGAQLRSALFQLADLLFGGRGRLGALSRGCLGLEARNSIDGAGGVFGDQRDYLAPQVNAVPLNGVLDALILRRCVR